MKLTRQKVFLSNKKLAWKEMPFNQLETNSKGSAFNQYEDSVEGNIF
jgi:hypothetical protein